jgi:molecular chaperone DnaK (HSP70)
MSPINQPPPVGMTPPRMNAPESTTPAEDTAAAPSLRELIPQVMSAPDANQAIANMERQLDDLAAEVPPKQRKEAQQLVKEIKRELRPIVVETYQQIPPEWRASAAAPRTPEAPL